MKRKSESLEILDQYLPGQVRSPLCMDKKKPNKPLELTLKKELANLPKKNRQRANKHHQKRSPDTNDFLTMNQIDISVENQQCLR